MVWLFVAILLSTAFAQVMKWAVARGCSTAQVAAVNYFVASGSAVATGLLVTGLRYEHPIVAIGVLGGVSYAVAVVAIFNVIRLAGVAVAGTLMRVSTMVAIVGAIFLFHEMPTAAQWVGIALVVAGAPLLQPAQGRHIEPKVGWALAANALLVIASNGTGFLTWKMTHAYGGGQLQEFQSLLFGVPMLTCAAESRLRGEGITRAAVVIGVVLGVINFTSGWSSLEGLRSIPAVVFFPIYNAGGVLSNTAASVALWGERLSRRTLLGIGVACLALVLMSWK